MTKLPLGIMVGAGATAVVITMAFLAVNRTGKAINYEGEIGLEESKHNYVPTEGYVPNAGVAIKIAVAVWGPIYGPDNIAKQTPFHATLSKEIWTVEGSLPDGMRGGVALAEISKTDGRIIRVSHGK